MLSITLQQIIQHAYANVCPSKQSDNPRDFITALKNKCNNETAEIFHYGFIDSNHFLDIPILENVLFFPINSDDEQVLLFNAILSITMENYLNLSKNERLNIINTFQTTPLNYVKNNFYNLIIFENNKIKFYNGNGANTIVLLKYEENYLSFYNIVTKHYSSKSKFVACLLKTFEHMPFVDLEIKNGVEKEEEEEEGDDDDVEKSEFVENIKRVSELESCDKIQLDEKRTILECMDEKEIPVKTIPKIKQSMTLGELQDIAKMWGIEITSGETKTKKTPKNKTKQELIMEIEKMTQNKM